jgi:cell division septation protein DedD
MKLQKTPLILLFSALALGSFVFLQEVQKPSQKSEIKSEAQPVFAFKEADVKAFRVQTSKQTLKFEKSAPSGPEKNGAISSSAWRMIAPENTPANEASVAFLLSLMATSRSDRTLPTPVGRKSEFGLESPFATVEVQLGNQKTHRLLLGKPNFNRTFLYALADPPTGGTHDLAVLQVPIDFQNAVDRPLFEWKQLQEKSIKENSIKENPKASPISAPTPTSSPTSTPSPAVSPSVSPTPSPTSSPSP